MAKISNEQFVSEFEDFVDISLVNKTELNFSSDDQTVGDTLKTNLISQLNSLQAARSAFDSAEATFDATRKTASEFQKSRKKYFGANPAVSDATKAALSIVQSSASGAGVIAQPLNLSAEGYSSGINTLKWERNNNPSYRNFTIEYRIGEDGQWLIAGTTRKTMFNHKNQTPGVKIYYRVYAHTDEEQSPRSNTAVVYA